ncbi:MAG: hypothetical protein ACREH8_06825 [Opitutaceae bacterium]
MNSSMTVFFLVGSLTVGAALVFGLTELVGQTKLLCGAAAVLGGVYIWSVWRSVWNFTRTKPMRIYEADSEAERYTETDVLELIEALSEAKAKSTPPFNSRTSGPTQ